MDTLWGGARVAFTVFHLYHHSTLALARECGANNEKRDPAEVYAFSLLIFQVRRHEGGFRASKLLYGIR